MSTHDQLRKNRLSELLVKFKELRVPQDENRDLDEEYLEEDELLGNLPALMIDVEKDLASETTGESTQYPSLLLYENDLIVDKV